MAATNSVWKLHASKLVCTEAACMEACVKEAVCIEAVEKRGGYLPKASIRRIMREGATAPLYSLVGIAAIKSSAWAKKSR